MLSQVDRATAGWARDAVIAALRAFEEPGGVVLRGAAWVVTATRPAVE
jgi:hypothetical protein